MTSRVPARRRDPAADLDEAIAAAEAGTIVVWGRERIRFPSVRERIARLDGREAREHLYAAYLEAVEELNPLYEDRLALWKADADQVERATAEGTDPRRAAVDLERFHLHAETPYYAALRRYLALVGIEQGDATDADLWHIFRGGAWSHWFGQRELARAMEAVGRAGQPQDELDGWRAAERDLGGDVGPEAGFGALMAAAARRTLIGAPAWLRTALQMNEAEIPAFADFAAFVRLYRLRRRVAELHYELRLFATDEPALQRAYFSGILGYLTGVAVSEAEYLRAVSAPFASIRAIEAELAGAMLIDTLEQRHGERWWEDPATAELVDRVERAGERGAALAELGYDAVDWRPAFRQIRTRLIGEMSGYGGPNITTRAGTRKV